MSEMEDIMEIKSHGLEIQSAILHVIDGRRHQICLSERTLDLEDPMIEKYVSRYVTRCENDMRARKGEFLEGSEFEKVLMPILGAAPMLLTRNVLYTGMTRAKNKLTIIGSSNTIGYMISNTDSRKRNSGLKYKLEEVL